MKDLLTYWLLEIRRCFLEREEWLLIAIFVVAVVMLCL
jgi:hypothetical protein